MIKVTDIAALRAALSGSVLISGDQGYDEACSAWNGEIDRHPAVSRRRSCLSSTISSRATG
jgi:hypothetical protein